MFAFVAPCPDRAYRIGQQRDVKVYRFITAGTLEELIYWRQVFVRVCACACARVRPILTST